MQLFITDFKQHGNQININNKEILDQMRKVLRMEIGDKFFVQNDKERYKIEITDRDKSNITGNILEKTKNKLLIVNHELGITIAMSNKRPKIELIIQKLSEIGIKNIYIRPSERSVIKDTNEKKMERLYKISKEAVEQSRGRKIPKIEFIKDISRIIQNKKIIIFDKSDNSVSLSSSNLSVDRHNEAKDPEKQNIIGIIGPEGGLTPKDYQKFGNNYEIISLGDTVLRTETASIIAGRKLKNLN